MEAVPSANESEQKLHFLDYWRIIRIRKFLILSIFLLVVATTAVVTYWLPKTYASTVRMNVQKNIRDVEVFEQSNPNAMPYDPYWIQTQFEILQSKSVLTNVINDMRLGEVWGKRMGEDAIQMTKALDILKNRMQVRNTRNTSLIEIKVFSEDPIEASGIANKIAAVYRANRVSEQTEISDNGIQKIREQLKAQDEVVRARQKDVDDLRSKLGINDIGSSDLLGGTLDQETLRHYESLRIDADAKYEEPHAKLAELKKYSPAELKEAILTVQYDDNLARLKQSEAEYQQQLAIRKKELGDDHPDVKKLAAALAVISNQIDDRVKGIMNALETTEKVAKGTLDRITQEVENAKAKNSEAVEKNSKYNAAKRDFENAQRVRDVLSLKITEEETKVKVPMTLAVQITDPAEPIQKAVRPNIPINIALGIIVGLIAGIGLAFFIEYLDTSVKTIDEIERALQSQVIGVIPQNVHSLIEEGEGSPHAEAYRVLRTNLLFARKDERHNTITIVSAGAGEGKSTTIFNLAVIFAQNNQRVLLVDSDLRRPSLHKLFKVSNSAGLTSHLLNQKTLPEVIQTSEIPGLDFLPSGKLPASSIGILNSPQMREFIQNVKRRYDWVFFDSPPILGVSDASILVSEMDMALLVIQYRKYPQAMSIRAKQTADKVGGNLLGVVLNNINISQDASYYYYSGYHYSNYASENDEDDSDKPAAGGTKEPSNVSSIKQKY